jgi:UDP-glucose 4-epimerase
VEDRGRSLPRFLQHHRGEEGFRFEAGSVLDLNVLRRCVVGADVVFHLSAQTDVGSVTDPAKAQLANTTGTLNVLLAAKNAGVRRVISTSSSTVYGNPGSLPVRETEPTIPTSPQGAGMLAAEEYCRLFHDLYGLQSVSLRYFTVYGPRQDRSTTISGFAERALRGQRPQIHGDGGLVRDFVFITDAVDAIRRCADCADPKGQALNVCSGKATTTVQVANELLKAVGRPDLEIEFLPSRQDGVERMWGDNTRARKLLDWEPKVPMDKGLVEFAKWYEKSKEPTDPAGARCSQWKKDQSAT